MTVQSFRSLRMPTMGVAQRRQRPKPSAQDQRRGSRADPRCEHRRTAVAGQRSGSCARRPRLRGKACSRTGPGSRRESSTSPDGLAGSFVCLHGVVRVEGTYCRVSDYSHRKPWMTDSRQSTGLSKRIGCGLGAVYSWVYIDRGSLRLSDYAAGVTKSSRIRNAADDPASTRQSRMKSTASRIRLSRLSSSGRP